MQSKIMKINAKVSAFFSKSNKTTSSFLDLSSKAITKANKLDYRSCRHELLKGVNNVGKSLPRLFSKNSLITTKCTDQYSSTAPVGVHPVQITINHYSQFINVLRLWVLLQTARSDCVISLAFGMS